MLRISTVQLKKKKIDLNITHFQTYLGSVYRYSYGIMDNV